MHSAQSDHWHETSAGIYYAHGNAVLFYDDWDHWRTGFCRLLEISQENAKKLIEECLGHENTFPKLSIEEKVEKIRTAVLTTFPAVVQPQSAKFSSCGMAFDGSLADLVFANSISGNSSKMIVGNMKLQYAWQIDAETQQLVRADSINYDELYFQDPQQAHLGMRNYISDHDWRLEKARRQLRIVLRNMDGHDNSRESTRHLNDAGSDLRQTTALDVGSAAGYFRKALDEAGVAHYGLEQSEDAIKICMDKFGYTTLIGEIVDLPAIAPQLIGKIDIITLWDVIEHVDDGINTLNILKQFLSERGVIVVRTPNLVSLEYDLLGDYYYSFKLDHIKYYSPNSLNSVAQLCGLHPVYLETTSHIFKGLLGMDFIHQRGLERKGADIIAIYRRTSRFEH